MSDNQEIESQVIETKASQSNADNFDEIGSKLEDLKSVSQMGDYAAIIGGELIRASDGTRQVELEFELVNGTTFKDAWDVPLHWDGSTTMEMLISSLNVKTTATGLPEILNRRVPAKQDADGNWVIDESAVMIGDYLEYQNPLYDQYYNADGTPKDGTNIISPQVEPPNNE